MESGLANVIEPYQHGWGIRIPFSFFYSRSVFFFSYFHIPFPFCSSSFSFHFVRNLLIFIFSDVRTIHSLGCQCWALGMHDGFVSLRLSRTPQFSRFSHACVPSLPFAPPFPSSLGNATTSVSLAFPVSLARASY